MVSKMSYCMSSKTYQKANQRRREAKLFRKASSGSTQIIDRLTQLRLGREQSTGRLSLERLEAK